MSLEPYVVYEMATILPPIESHVNPYDVSVVFDIDDTIWTQFALAAKAVGVDPAKLDNFVVQNNPYYTNEEKARLFEAFRDVRLFEQAEFYPGIEKMIALHELGIKIRFDSKSFTEEISAVKRRRLKEKLPFLEDSDLRLVVREKDHAATGKNIGPDVTFFVDDNPYNILTSAAVYNLLPQKTWNTDLAERERMSGKNFYIMSSLDVIIETIRSSVHYWRALHPATPSVTSPSSSS